MWKWGEENVSEETIDPLINFIDTVEKNMKRKPRNIIFLDIDGVLNSRASLDINIANGIPRSYIDLPYKTMVDNLNLIIDKADAYIVISSIWRMIYSLKGLRDIFYLCGIRPDRIIGKTPRCDSKLERSRYYEIENWIRNNARKEKMDKFVVIDDDTDALIPSKSDTFIKTNWTEGLTKEQALKAIKVLTT